MKLIDDPEPLQKNYLPETIVDRENLVSKLNSGLQGTNNLHIYGERGTGKTHLTRRALSKVDNKTAYIHCIEHDTQYQVLRKLLEKLKREPVSTGHHTSELQRQLEDQAEVFDITVVLDELDFLLFNDGDDLLYTLSRTDGFQIVTISANIEDLREHIEPRTSSTLQSRKLEFEPYTEEKVYEVLADRASKSLKPQSIHRNALKHISTQTQNLCFGLTWLRTSAETSEDSITETTVRENRETAVNSYIDSKLARLSDHHKQLYRAVEQLCRENTSVNAGSVYQEYHSLAGETSSLSDRRLSDFLKQLEKLNLINTEYHYGGKKGKTREIELAGINPTKHSPEL
jgi:Cdc6-like AAA superfamily ATPase